MVDNLKLMGNVKQVSDDIAIAGQLNLAQLQEAAEEGFAAVLNLRSPDEEGSLSDEQEQVEALGLDYINIPVATATINEDLTTQVLQTIDELPKPLLIHCASSMRAGAMAFMYVATRQGLTAEQAFEKANQMGFDCDAYPDLKAFFKQYVDVHSRKTA
ncbi:MAG: protein tyrosine phosphatase family protein [Oculatellaceae cyanobacterium Prado106]|jgi:uncharacterized protein (TIGR01244 family)|nr:protein tyrosine phosphatase family protein [Oculatellaceae cyanobacterium Prado106]